MNILIVANHWAVCSARYAADAFTRLGHSVRHVGQPMGRDIWGMQVPEQYVWTPDNEEWARGAAINEFPDWHHDIAIVMDSDPYMLDTSIGVTGKAPVVVWGVDNHVRDYRRPWFDHYFLAHKSVSVMGWGELIHGEVGSLVLHSTLNYPDMTWLPCAYDPVAFPPSPIPWAEREYDVCMVGVMYPQRWGLVNALRSAGLKVLAGTGLVYDAYRDAYHNSRVALVSSFNGDLPIRLFEGAGMGCAVLCDEIADLTLLNNGSAPVWEYGTVQEAVGTASYLQESPGWGAEWAKDHTWDARCKVILDWLEARS